MSRPLLTVRHRCLGNKLHTVALMSNGQLAFHHHTKKELAAQRNYARVGGPPCACLAFLDHWQANGEGSDPWRRERAKGDPLDKLAHRLQRRLARDRHRAGRHWAIESFAWQPEDEVIGLLAVATAKELRRRGYPAREHQGDLYVVLDEARQQLGRKEFAEALMAAHYEAETRTTLYGEDEKLIRPLYLRWRHHNQGGGYVVVSDGFFHDSGHILTSERQAAPVRYLADTAECFFLRRLLGHYARARRLAQEKAFDARVKALIARAKSRLPISDYVYGGGCHSALTGLQLMLSPLTIQAAELILRALDAVSDRLLRLQKASQLRELSPHRVPAPPSGDIG
jgi:hypothetical protein